jgi:chromosome segregation ATPase
MSDEINDSNIEIDSEDAADAVLDTLEQPDNSPIKEEQPAPVDEFEITVGGKQIKAKRDQVMQWAQQGYSAPGKLSQLSKEVEGWKRKLSEYEPKYKELETKFNSYKEIDDYVRQNPAFWDNVLKSWETRTHALTDQSNPLAGTVSQLQEQVQGLIQYKNQIEEQQAKFHESKEDQDYLQTFEEIKKSNPDVDFVTPDEEGKTLEYRVLEHAHANGIKNFKTAFRDFYHDELMKRTEARTKENLSKEKQKNTKLGILGITDRPTKRSSSDVRGKSYDDIADEIKQEFGFR